MSIPAQAKSTGTRSLTRHRPIRSPDTLIHKVRFDDATIHLELTDGRILSVPLWWVPSVHNASMEEREKFEISRDHRMVIWDPDKCAINDELRTDDYLAPKGA